MLYLQVDNCWRENKNRLLCFLAVLIEMGIFTKVKTCALIVVNGFRFRSTLYQGTDSVLLYKSNKFRTAVCLFI